MVLLCLPNQIIQPVDAALAFVQLFHPVAAAFAKLPQQGGRPFCLINEERFLYFTFRTASVMQCQSNLFQRVFHGGCSFVFYH